MLEPGTKLGVYEVRELIGVGGMGEVYRGFDPRLRREVAIKVLPGGYTADPESVRRFEQEARSTGKLSHPNVVTVFDFGTHDESLFIVSELLEGETLRSALGKAMTSRAAVETAAAIAEGLAAAHERGVVHRDIKPENVFITAEGAVKILDFGLAKLRGIHGLSEDETARHATDPGTLVGTASYMSPEQVRGQEVDHRSDLFSLGCVLFEMLAGQRPFRKESAVETMNAILHDEPPPLPTGKGFPALQRIVTRLLDKRPAQRFQSAKDLAFALASLSQSGERPADGAGVGSEADEAFGPGLGRARFRRLTFRRGSIMSARFATDGSVVYGARWEDQSLEIFTSYPGNPESRPLGLPSADVLDVSPTGELAISLGRRYITGWGTSGTLARVPLFGGAPREVLEGVQEATWGPDGKELAVIRFDRDRFVLEYPIGQRIFESTSWISHFRFSPDGQRIALLQHPYWGDDAGAMIVIDLEGNPILTSGVFNSASGLAWSPDGDRVLVAAERARHGRGVIAISMSGAERVLFPVGGRCTVHDCDSNGRLLIAFENGRREIVFAARGGGSPRNLSWFDWSFLVGLSNDGSLILIEEQGLAVGESTSIYVRGVDGSPAVRLGEGRARSFMPDGRWVLSVGEEDDRLVLLPVGAGRPQSIAFEGLEKPIWWEPYPDGLSVVLYAPRPGVGPALHRLVFEGNGKVEQIGPEGVKWPFAAAPDGRSIAAISPEHALVIYSPEEQEGAEVPGSVADDRPLQWSPDGRMLYVYRPSLVSCSIDRIQIDNGERERWDDLSPPDPAGVLDVMPVRLTPTGHAYAYGYRRLLSDLYVIEGVLQD